MKIVFLDIDGVLNGYGLYDHIVISLCNLLHIKPKIGRKFLNTFGVHYSKVKLLSKITHKTNSVVVMTSTWRASYFNDACNTEDIVRLRKLFKKFDIRVISRTPYSTNGVRGEEIKEWLNHNKNTSIQSFVIIDDETCDIIEYFPDKIVRTSETPHDYMIKGHWRERTGLKRKHIKEAIRILNTKL